MHDPEFDAFTRDDLVAEIKEMRLKFKDEVIAETEKATAEERRLLSEATVDYHAAAHLVAKLPLEDVLARLNKALLNIRPASLVYPGFRDLASARGLVEFFLQHTPKEYLTGCAAVDCERKQADRLSRRLWLFRGRISQ